MLTQERLKSLLDYDLETGIFTWRARRGGTRSTPVAGTLNKSNGRIYIKVDDKVCFAHRLAWLWMTGAWPPNTIDHRDCDPTNNRWSNLRLATSRENSLNRGKHRTYAGKPVSSQYKGVSLLKSGKWQSLLSFKGKHYRLGSFANETDAGDAYAAKARELHGEFVRLQHEAPK